MERTVLTTVLGAHDGPPAAARHADHMGREAYLQWRTPLVERATRARRAVEDEVTALADEVGAPLLIDALSGTPEQIRASLSLVRAHVEEHGADAPTRLAGVALTASNRVLQVNLARAALALESIPAGNLTDMFADAKGVGRRRRRGRS